MEPVPRKVLSLLLCCAGLAAAGEAPAAAGDLAEKLALIRLPPGFEISVYAEGVENARQLALGDRGTVFAGSRDAGKVHAAVDRDGDHRADRVLLVAEGLEMPSGLEFRQGSLYVAALDRILRYDDIEQRLPCRPSGCMPRSSRGTSGTPAGTRCCPIAPLQ